MVDRDGVTFARASGHTAPWRERILAHVGMLVVTLLVLGLATAYLGKRVLSALPNVGKTVEEREPWAAPVAVERLDNGVLLAHIAPCAQGPVVGLFLWEGDDGPSWQVEGRPSAMDAFFIGVSPPGFQVIRPWRPPPRSAVLRVGVLRSTGRPAGATFRISSLRQGKVRYGGRWVTVEEFDQRAKCAKSKVKPKSTATSSVSTVASTEPTVSTAPLATSGPLITTGPTGTSVP